MARASADGWAAGEVEVATLRACRLVDTGEVVVPVRTIQRATGVLLLSSRVEASDFVSWVAEDGGRPLVSVLQTQRRGRHRRVDIDYRWPDLYHLETSRPGRRTYRSQRPLPAGVVAHDLPSMLARLRNWHPAPGTRVVAHVVVRRRLWRVVLAFIGPDDVSTPGGPVAALRIDGTATKLRSQALTPTASGPRPFSLWLSADEHRVPLRAVGQTRRHDLELELIDYESPDPTRRSADVPICGPARISSE